MITASANFSFAIWILKHENHFHRDRSNSFVSRQHLNYSQSNNNFQFENVSSQMLMEINEIKRREKNNKKKERNLHIFTCNRIRILIIIIFRYLFNFIVIADVNWIITSPFFCLSYNNLCFAPSTDLNQIQNLNWWSLFLAFIQLEFPIKNFFFWIVWQGINLFNKNSRECDQARNSLI